MWPQPKPPDQNCNFYGCGCSRMCHYASCPNFVNLANLVITASTPSNFSDRSRSQTKVSLILTRFPMSFLWFEILAKNAILYSGSWTILNYSKSVSSEKCIQQTAVPSQHLAVAQAQFKETSTCSLYVSILRKRVTMPRLLRWSLKPPKSLISKSQ